MIGIEPRDCSFLSIAVDKCGADVVASRDSLSSSMSGTLAEEEDSILGTQATVVTLLDVFCDHGTGESVILVPWRHVVFVCGSEWYP